MDRLFFKYLAPLLAITIVPILAIVLLLFFFIRNNITELEFNLIDQNTASLTREISYKNEAIAKTEGMYMEQEIDRIGNKLKAMELDPDFVELESEKVNYYAEKILNSEPSILEIIIVNKWQEMIYHRINSMTLEFDKPEGENLRTVIEALEKRNPYISPVSISNTTQLPFILLGQPIIDYAGNYSGGIIVKLDLGFIWEIVAEKQIGEQGILYIISEKGLLISHPSKKEFIQNSDYSKYDYILEILNKENGTMKNEENLISFYTNKYNWTTVIEVPIEIALATVDDNKRTIQSFINATLKSISYFTVLIILFGLLISTIATIFITKRIITPILNFTHATKRISEGELSLKLEKKSNDEMGELTDSFNKMAEELRKEREELLKSNAYIKRQAEEVINRHHDYFEQYKHIDINELEKPLNRIKSYLKQFQTDKSFAKNEQVRTSMNNAINDIEQMDTFLHNLLEHSHLSTNLSDFVPVNFLYVFESVVEKFQKEIHAANADIKCSPLPTIKAIHSNIEQLFENLLSNAIEYSGDKPLEIVVSVQEMVDEWLFTVKDNGIGINLKKSGNIFEVTEHKNNGHGDFGFGLAMCKNIVERHGGHIWVDSKPGKGTTFSFTIKKF